MSLFANSNDALIRSMNRRSKLVRSLTTDENFENNKRSTPAQAQTQTQTQDDSSKRNKIITWSGSSPMKGFDLGGIVSNKPHHLQTRSHLIIKLKPVTNNTTNLRKV